MKAGLSFWKERASNIGSLTKTEWEDARAMCEELGAYLYWPNSVEEHEAVWFPVPSGEDGINIGRVSTWL